ncbi:sensor domain-containing protein [Halosimplex sp. J119]
MTATDSALRRFVGVTVDPQTYRNIAYLLLAFPLGILYFTVLWGGGATGISLVPFLLLGVPVLVAVLGVAVYLTELEARLARGLLGRDVVCETPRPGEETAVAFAKRLVTDVRSYRAVVYLLSKFVIGVTAFAALSAGASTSVLMVLAPFLYDHPEFYYNLGVWSVSTLPAAVGVAGAGVVVALLTLHAANLAARAVGEYTELMLGTAD